MSVLIETSKGDLVIDLFVDEAPIACKNFLKLCKLKYYNNCLFHNVQRNFIAQTGDPTATGKGGDSVFGLMYGPQASFFEDEFSPRLRHTARGCVGMASAGPGLNASQFYVTLGEALSSLDERHTLFGSVSEGLEVLEALGEAPVDADGRPLQNIRIRHTIVLEDPFDDPPQLADLVPDASPPPTFEHGDRLEEDWVPEEDNRPPEEVEKEARAAEAANRAVVLEMIGDLPEADVKPPSNMLFVCKLNPVTSEEDLDVIFGRFGNITSCDIIRDYKTGDSLCYAFIGFDNDQSCEAAYFKMNNVLIDDRRIRVDFSQSVSHIWKQFKRHGKAGGTSDMAAEAAGHQGGGGRGGGGGGGRGGGRAGGRFELRQQQQQLGGGGGGGDGLLFDHHHEPPPQQQRQHVERAAAAAGDGGRRRRWDDDASRAAPAAAGGGGRGSSRGHGSRSRSPARQGHPERSRSRSSRSRSRSSGERKQKKHKKEKHKKDKKERRHSSREDSRERNGHREQQRRPDYDDRSLGRHDDARYERGAGREHGQRDSRGGGSSRRDDDSRGHRSGSGRDGRHSSRY